MVPLGRGQDDDRWPVGVEVAGVLVGLDDERVPIAPARGGRDTQARERRRQQRPHEGAGIAARGDQDVDEPARGGALAMGAGDPDQPAPGRGIGHDLLPGLERDAGRPRGAELRVAGVDRGEGLGHREPGGRVGVQHVRRVVRRRHDDAGRVERGRVGPVAARVAAIDRGAGPRREQRRRGRAGAGRPDDVDALARADRPGVARRREPAPTSAASRTLIGPPRRARSASRARPAPSHACSPTGRPSR